MNRLSKHDVNKLTVKEMVEQSPFEVTADGKVILMVTKPHDVNNVKEKPKARHDVNRSKLLTELPLSKHKQAQSTW